MPRFLCSSKNQFETQLVFHQICLRTPALLFILYICFIPSCGLVQAWKKKKKVQHNERLSQGQRDYLIGCQAPNCSLIPCFKFSNCPLKRLHYHQHYSAFVSPLSWYQRGREPTCNFLQTHLHNGPLRSIMPTLLVE